MKDAEDMLVPITLCKSVAAIRNIQYETEQIFTDSLKKAPKCNLEVQVAKDNGALIGKMGEKRRGVISRCVSVHVSN